MFPVIIFLLMNWNLSSDLQEERAIPQQFVLTKAPYKNRKTKAFIYDGREVRYIRKYKPNKNQSGRMLEGTKAELVKEISRLDQTMLEDIENRLKNNPAICDSGFPYLLSFYNNGKLIKKYALEEYSNCYPKGTKVVMEKIAFLFDDE